MKLARKTRVELKKMLNCHQLPTDISTVVDTLQRRCSAGTEPLLVDYDIRIWKHVEISLNHMKGRAPILKLVFGNVGNQSAANITSWFTDTFP